MAGPLGDVDHALDRMAAVSADADSPWLVAPVADQLHSLRDKIAHNAPKVDNAVAAVALAPRMLGAEGPAKYLVLFTTPAEARGSAGSSATTPS